MNRTLIHRNFVRNFLPGMGRPPRRALQAIVLAAVLACFAAAPLAFAWQDSTKSGSESLPADLRTRTTGSDWPAFLGPTGDSKSTETGIRTSWDKKGLPLVWWLDDGVSYSMPSISRGRLFQFSRHGTACRLTCVKSETGEQLWQSEYPSDYADLYGYDPGPRTSPVVDGDLVFTFGPEGLIRCHRVETGEVVWELDTASKYGVIQNFFGVGSTPVIYQDYLIAQVGGSPPDSRLIPPGQLERVKPNGSCVVALHKRTGEVAYAIGEDLASYSGPKIAHMNGRDYGLLFARSGLMAWNPGSGAIDFQFPWRAESLESVNASNPVVVDDLIFLSETYGPGGVLLKLGGTGCDVVWSDENKRRNKSMQTHWNTPVFHDGYLYGSSGRHSNNAELRCVEFRTGKVMWSIPQLGRGSLLYVDGHFVCLTEEGGLILFKASPEKFTPVAACLMEFNPPQKEGEKPPAEAGEQLLPYPAWAAPILAHGLLYVRGQGRVACLELIPPETAEKAK